MDGCITVSSFVLIIEGVYADDYVEVPLFQVNDDDGTPDGFYEFDLDSQSPIITAGDPDLIVTYHHTEAEAVASLNPIDAVTPYTNICKS